MRYREIASRDLVFFTLCFSHVLPIYLKTFGFINYDNYLLSSEAYGVSDLWSVQIIYRVILFAVLAMLDIFGCSKKLLYHRTNHDDFNYSFLPIGSLNVAKFFSWVSLFLVIFSVLLTPDPTIYMQYGTIGARTGDQSLINYHAMISKIWLFGLFLFAFVFWLELRRSRKIFTLTCCLAYAAAFALCWLDGKRGSVFFVLIAISLISFYETKIKIGYYVILLLCFLTFGVSYSYFAKSDDASPLIQGELFRDYITLPCIGASHLTHSDIMPRGNGFLFNFVFWIPRRVWSDKPWTTPIYVTHYLVTGSDDVGIFTWGFGVGFIEEGLANFGYLGLVLYLVGIICVCRLIDRLRLKMGSFVCLIQMPLVYGVLFSTSVLHQFILFIGIPMFILIMIFQKKEHWFVVPRY